jgi:hypothetical protein
MSYTYGSDLTKNDDSNSIYKNEKFYFSVDLPADWRTAEVSEPNSILRLKSLSPDGRQSIYIYVIESKESIDLEKLADADSELFPNLGQPVDSKKIREYLVVLKRIEKTYKTNFGKTKLLFQVADNLGYILQWQSLDEDKDNTTYLNVSNTFDVNIPVTKTIMGWFTGIGAWIIGIVVCLLGIGILYLIGTTGQLIRRGINLRTYLAKAKKEFLLKGFIANEKYHELNRKSTYYIVLPLLGWGIVYIILFGIFSSKNFLLSLLALIPVVLGFFGILFGPGDDPTDYV